MRYAASKVPKRWQKLLVQIPGYDPFDDAGDCVFDAEIAEDVVSFFPECLVHIKGPLAGEPFEIEDWEKAIIANLFGWIRPDGTRRYRTAFIYVPRKNGKTPLTAGIVLYGMLFDGEGGAEIYSAAGEKDQAKLLFAWATGMIKKNPDLKKNTRIYLNSVVALDPETGEQTETFYKPLSADAKTKHGFNAHIVIVDELHVQPNSKLVDALETSQAARAQPLMVYLTTADYARESPCNAEYRIACAVRDGTMKDMSYLPVIYEAGKDDDYTDPKIWRKANPNFGISVREDYIISKCNKAIESPTFRNEFKRLHLNIQTEQQECWLDIDKWDLCTETIDIESISPDLPCYAGMDLATTGDIAAYVKVWPLEDGRFLVAAKFYCPKDNAYKRQHEANVPYITWAEEGHLTLTPGDVIDYSVIKKDLLNDWQRYNMIELAFDRWNFEALRQQFMADGIDQDKMVAFGQGYVSLSAPTKELEKLVISKKMIHNNNPVLRWMAKNVAVEMDSAANIKPCKKKSFEKIDGIVATIMALGRAMTRLPDEPSVYEERGVLTL